MKESTCNKNLLLIEKVRKRFNILEGIPIDVNLDLEKGEIFRLLTNGRGKKKSHCSSRYPKHEGELRRS